MQTKSDSGMAAMIIVAFRSYFTFCIILALSSMLFVPGNLEAQVPQGFNYQAIARDASGNLISGATIKVKLSILSDTTGFYLNGGTYIWEEEHTNVKTNSLGMFTVVLGSPTATKVQGSAASFNAIDWSLANLYVGTKIAVEPAYVYKVMGSAKLWSVPYALRANTSASEKWSQAGNDIYFFPPTLGKVGIWTSTPVTALTVTSNSSTGITYPLYIQNASGDWTAAEKGVGLKFGRINPTSGHDYGTIRGTIASANGGAGRLQFIGGGGTEPHMTIDNNGNVGIGIVSPGFKLDVVGRARFQAGGGSAGFWLMNDANTTNRSFVGMYNDDHVGFCGIGSNWGLVMNVNNGNVGIGVTAPTEKLQVNGGINAGSMILNSSGQTTFRMVKPDNPVDQRLSEFISSGTSFIGRFVNDAYNAADNWLTVTRNTGTYTVNSVLISGTKFGVGTSTPTGRAEIQAPSTWPDDVPLFQVKNKLGVPVLAVYNNGVSILVEDTDGKGVKGGFAIGGFDPTKAPGAETVNLMMVSPDSVRINIDNNPAKAVKGGFAIGSFDGSKAVNVNPRGFMQITSQASDKGLYNTFIGYQSGLKIQPSVYGSGNYNCFMGYQAGYSNVSGYDNVFMGYHAGYSNYGPVFGGTTNGINNIYIGKSAGELNLGGNNVCIGDESGKAMTNGFSNVYIGSGSGKSEVSGNYNTYIGAFAGQSETGSDNVMIGYRSGFGSGESNILVIGNRNNPGLITGQFNTGKLFLWASVGIGTSDIGSYKLYVNGSAFSTGGWTSSDSRWKKNITDLPDVLPRIAELKGVTYEWRKEEFPEKGFDSGKQIGLIAQEVEKVFPELVKTDDNGYKAVSYEKLTVILLEGVKEQQKHINEQEEKIRRLEKLVEELLMKSGSR